MSVERSREEIGGGVTAQEIAARWAFERLQVDDWRGLLARAFIEQRRELDRLRKMFCGGDDGHSWPFSDGVHLALEHAPLSDEKRAELEDARRRFFELMGWTNYKAVTPRGEATDQELGIVIREATLTDPDCDWVAAAVAAKSALLGVRRVAVPTREELARLLFSFSTTGVLTFDDYGERIQSVWLERADAVLRLLSAEAKAGQDSGGGGSAGAARREAAAGSGVVAQPVPPGSASDSPAQPSPPVTDNPRRTVLARDPNTGEYFEARFKRAAAPAVEERPWNYEAPPESEVGEEHELKLDAIERCPGDEARGWIYLGEEEGLHEWRHPNRWGRLAAFGISVHGWRRDRSETKPDPTPKAPGDDSDYVHPGTGRLLAAMPIPPKALGGAIDTIAKRVEEHQSDIDNVCQHVRVHRRLLQLVFDRVGALPPFTESWERIEREERERGA